MTTAVADELKPAAERADQNLKMRYVVFSDEVGIFLGFTTKTTITKSLNALPASALCWSIKNPEDYTAAPTFRSEREFKSLAIPFGKRVELPTYRLIQVFPDLRNDQASQDACANAGLPRWTT